MRARLGIDTGGTFTDAVLLDENGGVLATAKALTTHADLKHGIAAAIEAVLDGPDVGLDLVGLSTTLATNAVVEGKGGRAGLVLMGFTADFLDRGGLGTALGTAPALFVPGGHDAGGRALCPFDAEALEGALKTLPDLDALAVCGQFAVRNPAHEEAAARVIAGATGLPVTLSSSLSAKLDAPRRALTALLNARLIPFVHRLLDAVENLLAARGIEAPLMVVKGDGSLMTAASARARPVETILSGPAASVVGAAFLTGLNDAVVSDVGGTTTDVAVLEGGRPRLSPSGATLGRHRTMVEAIKMDTIGLGGDSALAMGPARETLLGPRRAVPLCQLAPHHPGLIAVLEAEAARGEGRALDGRFAVSHWPEGADTAALSKSQRQLLDLLREGPRTLTQVIERDHLAIPLRRLLERGHVVEAGFTPTDAAHVLGLQTTWAGPAAALGASLEARKGYAGVAPGDGRALARAVLDEAQRRSAAAILRAVLPEDDPLRPLLDPPHGATVKAALLDGGEAPGPVGLDFRLRLPVVAVGGPAALLYPKPVRRLGGEAVLPEHYAVCNAIGAVAGEVAERAVVTATRDGHDRLIVHLPGGRVETEDPAEARRLAEAAAADLARAKAAEAGATEVTVALTVETDAAALDDGTVMVFEIRALATARGRPALG